MSNQLTNYPLNMPSNTQIAVTGLAVVATGLVGYAAWFDYKRRNDAVFRKNLSEYMSGTSQPVSRKKCRH